MAIERTEQGRGKRNAFETPVPILSPSPSPRRKMEKNSSSTLEVLAVTTVLSPSSEINYSWSPPLIWGSCSTVVHGITGDIGSDGGIPTVRLNKIRSIRIPPAGDDGRCSKIPIILVHAPGQLRNGYAPMDGNASKIPGPFYPGAGAGAGAVTGSSSMVFCPPKVSVAEIINTMDGKTSSMSLVDTTISSLDGCSGPATSIAEIPVDTMDGNISRMSFDSYSISPIGGYRSNSVSTVESPLALNRLNSKLFLFETLTPIDELSAKVPTSIWPLQSPTTRATRMETAWEFISATMVEVDVNASRKMSPIASSLDGLVSKISPSGSPSSPSPPREARAGFSWRLLPDGHWQEKQKRKKKKKCRGKKSSANKDISASSSSAITPGGLKASCNSSRRPSVIRAFSSPRWGSCSQRYEAEEGLPPVPPLSQQQDKSPLSSVTSTARPSLVSRSTTTDKEKDKDKTGSGLYRRSMQFIRELRRSSATQKPEHITIPSAPNASDSDSTKSRTRELLEKASSLLRVSISIDGGLNRHGGRRSTSHTPSPSGESGSSSRHNVYHHHIMNRHGAGLSKSSSVLNILMGKPPATTPTEESMYTAAAGRRGSIRNDYFKVEISDPDGPSFLPSEAARIGTPPLPSDRPRKGNLRGFFFDYGSPGGESLVSDESDVDADGDGDGELQLDPRSAGRSGTMEESDWRLPFRFNPEGQEECEFRRFELNVPEHLPGSPLCPRSPLHPSGGKGICVYHGRTRTLPIAIPERRVSRI